MSKSYRLDPQLEAFVKAQVASGNFMDADEVVRAALSLLEQQQFRDERLDQSIAEANAGLVIDGETAFDELDRRLRKMVVHEN